MMGSPAAESFASSLFTRFDLTFLVAEPTRKGISVYRQWTDYAAVYDVALAVIGNKVHGPDDAAFLREHVEEALLACMSQSGVIRADSYDAGRYRFDGPIVLDRGGAFGYTVRVIPRNDLRTSVAELGVVAVARMGLLSRRRPLLQRRSVRAPRSARRARPC